MMIGMMLCLLSDTTAVDIRALVSQDINKAVRPNSVDASQTFVERVLGLPDFVVIIELALILIMAGLFIALVIRVRRAAKEQKQRVAAEQRMKVKMPSAISRSEIERILNQIASEKMNVYGMARGNYYVDQAGKLDSDSAIHEMARTHRMESERLNFAIKAASQSVRMDPRRDDLSTDSTNRRFVERSRSESSTSGTKQDGNKFKEAFALVAEDSDLNVLARQLNMGKGELELILALKKSKIANSRKLVSTQGGGQ